MGDFGLIIYIVKSLPFPDDLNVFGLTKHLENSCYTILLYNVNLLFLIVMFQMAASHSFDRFMAVP